MGRFFKTSTPQEIDYMFKLPEELMIKATQQAAEDISSLEQGIFSLAGKIDIQSAPIEDDRLRAKAIIGQYEDKINAMAQQLQADPLAFRKKAGEVTGLARDIHREWTKGEAAAITGRYLGYKNTVESFQKQIESGRIKDPQSVPFMINELLRKNSKVGYDPVTGGYNTWQDEQLVPHVDIADKYAGYLKNVKAQIFAKGGAYTDGKYIYENEERVETLTEQDLQNRAIMLLMGDSETQNYLLQRGRIGALQGFTTTDEFGNTTLIEPGKMVEENGVKRYQFDPNTKLGALMTGVTSLFTVNNVLQDKKSMQANPYGTQAEASENNKPTTPDSFNTPLSLKATLPTAESYHNGEAKTQIENTVASAYSYLVAGLQRKGLTSQALKNEMDNLNAAVAKANNGNATDLRNMYNTLPVDLINPKTQEWLNSYDDLYSSTAIIDYQYEALKEIVTPTAIRNMVGKNITEKTTKWNSLTPAQKQAKTDALINQYLPEISNQTMNVQATSGNNSDLWADPEIRKAANMHLAPALKFMQNPGNWGGSFYYSYPALDKAGKQIIENGKPKYITDQATITTSDVTGKLQFKTSKGSQYLIVNPQETPDLADIEEEAKESAGKTNSSFGTVQMVPYTVNFGYTSLSGTPSNKSGEWMFKVPVMGTDANGNTMQGYAFIDGSSVDGPEIQALKAYAEPNRKMLSIKKNTELALDAIDQLSNKLGVPYNKDVNLSFPGNLQFNVSSRRFIQP